MNRTRLGLSLASAVVVSLPICGAFADPPTPAAEEDWLEKELKTSIVEDGAIRWAGFGPGTVLATKTEQQDFGNSEMRTTLVRRESDGVVFRYETKQGAAPWGKAVERKLPGGPVAGAERKVDDLGKETIEVDGRKVECAKARWTRVVGGATQRPELIVWKGPAGAIVQWKKDEGDGWVSTFTVLRDDVEWRLLDRSFHCREIREIAVSAGMGGSMDRTGLWSRDVPDHVVRQSSKMTMGPGGPPQSQTFEVTMFGASPDVRAPASPTSATPGATPAKPATK